MTAYLFPGVLGLLTGLLLRWNGFSSPAQTRLALGLKRSLALRSALTALGWSMAAAALLCWLAVIDVDQIEVLPLSAGALAGGLLFGLAAGLSGFTPTAAFAGLAAAPPEAFFVLAGCFAGTWLLPELDSLLAPLRTAAPFSAATLFQVTLDEPWLLKGGFLGQGCAGLLLAAAALCIPSPRPMLLTDVSAPEDAAAAAVADNAALEAPPEESSPAGPEASATAPDEASAEVPAADAADRSSLPSDPPDSSSEADPPSSAAPFVALLEGEEPLIVDTAPDEAVSDSAGLADPSDPAEKAK